MEIKLQLVNKMSPVFVAVINLDLGFQSYIYNKMHELVAAVNILPLYLAMDQNQIIIIHQQVLDDNITMKYYTIPSNHISR